MKKLILLIFILCSASMFSQKKIKVNGTQYTVKESVIKGNYTVKQGNKTVAKVKYNKYKKEYTIKETNGNKSKVVAPKGTRR